MTRPFVAFLAVVAVLVLLGLLARPRLLLAPVVAFFAAWSWWKTLLMLPVHVKEWLVAGALEKNATALAAHAAAAHSLWSANSEFRPAAREIYGRVCAGYGIFAHSLDENEGDGPATPAEDPFRAAARAGAADAVTRGGLKAAPTPAGTGT